MIVIAHIAHITQMDHIGANNMRRDDTKNAYTADSANSTYSADSYADSAYGADL